MSFSKLLESASKLLTRKRKVTSELYCSSVMWSGIDPYDQLNKFYSCYMAVAVGIVNGHGLGIDMCHGN